MQKCILSRIVATLLLAAFFTTAARAQFGTGRKLIAEPTLVADTAAVEPGKPFFVGVRLKMPPHWHTYWKFGGTVSFPFGVEWKLPEGWEAAPVAFPSPHLIMNEDAQFLFGYEDDVLFPVKITPSDKPAQGEVRIAAKAAWQVCAKECVPEEASLELKLPVGKAAPANVDLFKKWLAEIPRDTEPPTHDVKFDADGQILVVRIGGLPKDATVEFFPQPPEGYGGTLGIKEKVTSETAPDGTRAIRFPFDEKIPAGLAWSGLLVVQKAGGAREGWMIGKAASGTPAPPKPEVKSGAVTEPDMGGWDPFVELKPPQKGLLVLLIEGFLGGLLLNLMPCVLPVISLKIFGFVQQAGQSRERVFRLGLAFCAGVFAFFAIIAGLIVALGKAFGWGAQFSNPVLLALMVGVIFVFALSLLGVFEITLGGAESKLSELSSKEGAGGAFMHGLFTTLLGTSCTAPLVGPVIGAAITRPGLQVFAMFGAIATGLSLPYFLLTWQPAWMKFLPKPGMWMVRFKQVMGFVMLGLVVWLLGSFAAPAIIVRVSAFLLVLGFGCWLYGSCHESRWALPVALIAAVGGWFGFVQGRVTVAETDGGGIVWEPFSAAKIRESLEAKKPVFVDFTADWCLNCKFYERTVLDTAPVIAAMKAKGLVTMKADYTRQPPDVKSALQKLGRAGVPVYVLFRKRGDAWIADGLTQSGLLEQINKL